ncbi:MAG: ABC transporter permease [Carboxylicivirga sp.]|nr:ABC transporter permease [Carboxylicivirga sp.]
MIIHVLKLIWKRKWHNALLCLQILIAFLVFTLLIGGVLDNVISFMKPLGYNYENVWRIQCYPNSRILPQEHIGKVQSIYMTLSRNKKMEVSKSSGVVPYTNYLGSTMAKSENTNKNITYTQYHIDVAFAELMNLNIVQGRWFEEKDVNFNNESIVITSKFREEYFGTDDVQIGNFINGKRIIGVVDGYRKKGELSEERPALFQLINDDAIYPDYLLKVPKGSAYQLESEIVDNIRQVAPGWNVKVVPLSNLRKAYMREKLMPYYIIGGISIIALINVLFGLFGILWYSISRRRIEIGLRRSVGADKKDIQLQFVLEILMVALCGLIPGSIIAMHFKMINIMEVSDLSYWLSIIITKLMFVLLVVTCTIVPGRQAARIQPALALSEE